MQIWAIILIAISLSMDAFAVAMCQGLEMPTFIKKHALIIALFFGVFQALMPLVGWAVGSQFEKYITNIDHWIVFGLLGFIGGKMIVDSFKKDDENQTNKETDEEINDLSGNLGIEASGNTSDFDSLETEASGNLGIEASENTGDCGSLETKVSGKPSDFDNFGSEISENTSDCGNLGIEASQENRTTKNKTRRGVLNIKKVLLLAIATSIDALAVGITFAFLNTKIVAAVSVIGVVAFVLSFLGVFLGNRIGTKFKNKAELLGGIVLVAIGIKILLEHLEVLPL